MILNGTPQKKTAVWGLEKIQGWHYNTQSYQQDGLPSGKRLHNYGKSQFSMGKSTINGHVQ